MILRKYTLTFCLAMISCAATRYLDTATSAPIVTEEVPSDTHSKATIKATIDYTQKTAKI